MITAFGNGYHDFFVFLYVTAVATQVRNVNNIEVDAGRRGRIIKQA